MVVPAKQGQSSSSNSTSTHQWITTNTPEGPAKIERLWSRWGRGGALSSSLGQGRRPEARPARLRHSVGVWMSVCEERNKLREALFIAEAEAGIESSPEFSGASPGDEWCQ